MAAAAFSHFVLDLPMHPSDMALWPNSDAHLGFGLWQALPVGWWFVELGLIAACGAYYLQRATYSDAFGRRPGLALAGMPGAGWSTGVAGIAEKGTGGVDWMEVHAPSRSRR